MYIWEKYRTFEITSGIILKMNLLLYKGFTLEITNKWWPLTTLSRWLLYRIKLYSKMHRESTKVTVMKRWPLYKGDRYDRFDCIWFWVDSKDSGILEASVCDKNTFIFTLKYYRSFKVYNVVCCHPCHDLSLTIFPSYVFFISVYMIFP